MNSAGTTGHSHTKKKKTHLDIDFTCFKKWTQNGSEPDVKWETIKLLGDKPR